MKRILLSLILLLSFQLIFSQQDVFDNPPKKKAEIFAKDLVSSSDKEHGRIIVSPDWQTIYWDYVILPYKSGDPQRVACIEYQNGEWTKRNDAKFNSQYSTGSVAYLNDSTLLFRAEKNASTDSINLIDEYWIITKNLGVWSKPKPLGFDRFTTSSKWSFTVANNGNIYFDDKNYEHGQYGSGIYVSKFVNGEYTKPKLLPENINSKHFDWTPFIAPDESFLLFASNRPGSMGSTDVYISFRKDDGTWSDPINMGEKVNSENLERWPSLSPDGKIFFFQRDYIVDGKLQEQDFYWIDAQLINDLKPENLK